MYHPGLFLPSYACSVESMEEEWEVVDSPYHIQEECEVVDSPYQIQKWHNFVRGICTLRLLRGFWAQLGAYLKEVKKRSLSN